MKQIRLPIAAIVNFIALLFAIIALSTNTLQAQAIMGSRATITITFTGAETLDIALNKLSTVSNIKFAYDADKLGLKKYKAPAIHFTAATIGDILNALLAHAAIGYRELAGSILLYQNKGNPQTLHGKVSDAATGLSLPGATLRIAGLNRSVAADNDGNYQVGPLRPGQYLLQVSYIGYVTQEVVVKVNGDPLQDLDLKLRTDHTLKEVVVTALGLKREERSLGYSVAKVNGEQLSSAPSNNWIDALSGKVAGLTLDKASSGPAGSVRVTLRGESSLNLSNNQALFVVDGVPINNDLNAAGGDAQNTGAGPMPVDFGNGSSELNPEDIESVTVLKGAGATALYGSRAANGAIVITTKSGSKAKGFGVSYSFGVDFNQVNKWPDLQYDYGSGGIGNNTYYQYGTYNGVKSTSSSQAWGPKYDAGTNYYQLFKAADHINVDAAGNRIATPWIGYPDYFKGFFQTGTTFRNTVTLEGGDDKAGTLRLSYTNLDNKYIVPNTGYKENSLSLSLNKDINRIKIGAKVNYYNKASDNLPALGYGASSVMYSLITSTPNINPDWLKHYWVTPDVAQWNDFNTSADNPYFIAYEQLNAMNRNRVFGNVNATISIVKKLNLLIRSGLDMYSESRSFTLPISSLKAVNGSYREQDLYSNEMNNDFLFTYKDRLLAKNKLAISVSFGGNNMTKKFQNKQQTAEKLVVPGVYNLANAQDRPLSTYFRSDKIVNSLYGLAQFNYGSYIYVDVTGRNDWSSTLPAQNNSYFYPSVSASILMDEILGLQNNPYLSLAKIRLSYAQVGNDTSPYSLTSGYLPNTFGGSYSLPAVANNVNLLPEKITGYEAGLALGLFKGRLNIDATYYIKDSKNLIMSAPVDPSSGVLSAVLNTGHIKNAGVELAISGTVVKTNDFSLLANATWSANRSKVLALAPSINTWVITNGPRGTVEAREGGSTGAMYGYGFLRAPQGSVAKDAQGNTVDVSNKIIFDKDGYPLVDRNDYNYQGEITPQWHGSFGFTARYKSLSLTTLLDGQYGGHVYSVTWQKLNTFGKSALTVNGRYAGIVGDGVQQAADGSYTINKTVSAQIGSYYNAYYNIDNVESNRVSTSYLKLREVSLQYQLPKKWLQKVKFIDNTAVSLYGRDLFIWTNYPIFDPEVASLNGANITPGFETAQLPSTRTLGLKFMVKF